MTGSSGGVGSIAVDMLDGRGYEVVAVTGKADQQEYLARIGARRVLLRDDIDFGKRPLEKGEWAGAIDNLGGDYLTWLTRTMNYGGNIASVGLAATKPERRFRFHIWSSLATETNSCSMSVRECSPTCSPCGRIFRFPSSGRSTFTRTTTTSRT